MPAPTMIEPQASCITDYHFHLQYLQYCSRPSEPPPTAAWKLLVFMVWGPSLWGPLFRQSWVHSRSIRSECHRFPLFLLGSYLQPYSAEKTQVHQFLKHKCFSDCYIHLVNFSEHPNGCFVNFVHLYSCFWEKNLPVSSLGHGWKSCLTLLLWD